MWLFRGEHWHTADYPLKAKVCWNACLDDELTLNREKGRAREPPSYREKS
jgi:hypothetical protein